MAVGAADLGMQQAFPANRLRADHLHFIGRLNDIPRMRLPIGHRHTQVAARRHWEWHAIRLHRCKDVVFNFCILWLLKALVKNYKKKRFRERLTELEPFHISSKLGFISSCSFVTLLSLAFDMLPRFWQPAMTCINQFDNPFRVCIDFNKFSCKDLNCEFDFVDLIWFDLFFFVLTSSTRKSLD